MRGGIGSVAAMKARALAAAALLALVIWPAAAILPATEWNLHVWSRLRERHRRAPDTDTDALYRRVAGVTPPDAVIGLVLPPSMSATDQQRTLYFVQYAVAPRRVSVAADAPFLVAIGPGLENAPAIRAAGVSLLHDLGDDVRVYRRQRP